MSSHGFSGSEMDPTSSAQENDNQNTNTSNTNTNETLPLLGGPQRRSYPRIFKTSNKNSKNNKNKNNNPQNTSSSRLDTSTLPSSTSSLVSRSLGLPVLTTLKWFPGAWDVRDVETHDDGNHKSRYQPPRMTTRVREYRSPRRRLYLWLTEPDTSLCSALFFIVLVLAIMTMNVLMMVQTMRVFQYTPTDCVFCGGDHEYLFDDDSYRTQLYKQQEEEGQQASQQYVSNNADGNNNDNIDCVCPPTPFAWTDRVLQYLVYFFTIEWILRVLTFCPAPHQRAATYTGRCGQFFWDHLLSWPMVLDFWATFPYYMEFLGNSNGLMSLRLLRLFRVFQLVRLGSYNATFTTLISVLNQALPHLKLLTMILLFGAALFGSLIFWLEKGTWQYWEESGQYEFVRTNEHGQLEISPFTSIPATFYWFMVTATTVGYGDVYPTTPTGRWVGVLAMLTGVLVIAFPVGVFSDLWSKELEKAGALRDLDNDDEEDDDDNEGAQDSMGPLGDALYKTRAVSSVPEEGLGSQQQLPQQQELQDSDGNIYLEEFLHQQPESGGGGDSLLATATLNPYSAHRVHPVTGSAQRNWNYGYQHAPHVATTETVSPSEIVILQRSDLAEILVQLQQLQANHKHIRGILKKYKIVKSNYS